MRINVKNVKVGYLFLIISCFLFIGTLGLKEVRAEALDTDVVTFKDANLETVIRKKLGKPTGDITVGNMKSMTGRLFGYGMNISDLTGLEHAVNITELNLGKNQIVDIAPISGMVNLTNVTLNNNKIGSIEALRGINGIREVHISNNQISDISPLSGKVQLDVLYADNNKINDISEFKDLPDISTLDLSNNNISDISFILNMNKNNFYDLRFSNNKISDISYLKDMNITNELRLDNNQISDISALSTISGVKRLCLNNNNIKNLKAVEGITTLESLEAESNSITDIPSLTSLTKLRILGLDNNDIKDISDLRNCVTLEGLYLKNNHITGIEDLSDLVNMKSLDLSGNEINNIDALENMVELTSLDLQNNKINDISIIKNFVKLYSLYLNDNEITDISSLENLEKISTLYLYNNEITDISHLSKMIDMYELNLKNNNITSIPEFIGNFKDLCYLDLRNNLITGEIPEFINNLEYLEYKDSYNEDNPTYTSFSGNYITGTVPSALKAKLEPAAFYNNLLEGENNQKQLTLLPGAKLNLYLNSSVKSDDLKNITKLFDGEDSNSKSIYELELVPVDEGYFDESGKVIKPGTTTAYIKIKGIAESNAYAKTLNVVTINISDKIGANNDITIDFSIDNSLEVTLGSNTINFGTISSVGGEVQSTTLTVTSSLPYDVSTMAYGDFIGSLDNANIIPIDKISLDIDSLGYNPLSKVKALVVGDSPSGLGVVHNLDFKMGNTLGYKKDNYNTSIQFIVDTK